MYEAGVVTTLVHGQHLTVIGPNIPMVWEESIKHLWVYGREIPTEYDKSGDPMSCDLSATLIIHNPMTEPRIHRAIPDGIDGLFNYVDDVVKGTRDKDVGKLGYTYHDRMVNYPSIEIWDEWYNGSADVQVATVNQLDIMINKLKECPHTRRAQMIIWVPSIDNNTPHACCLQRVWCRIVNGALEMNIHMRSNDAFKAAFMNMFAFTSLQKEIADQLGVNVGRYCHIVDSYHIYGSYFAEVEGFLMTTKSRSFEERTWNTAEAYYLQYGSFPMGTDTSKFDPDKIKIGGKEIITT